MTPPPLSLSPAAHTLAQHLHDQLRERWAKLPGESPARPNPVPSTARAAPIPDDLRGRRAELIVEASDLGMLRRAVNSDADAVVVDFDDTFSPTRDNVQAAYDALAWAAQSDRPLLARTRALYATEPHLDFGGADIGGADIGGVPAIAALCDLSVVLTARPGRPLHIYIPKLETPAEAQFWQDVLLLAEEQLGLAPNTVRTCLQIETFSGLLNVGAVWPPLAPRTYGLNAGRWDYVFSLTKHLGRERTAPLPPRPHLTMEVDAMRAYAETLVGVCRQHGAEAIGGTASFAPDPHNPQPALDAVLADKQLEAAQGFTAAWAGLPELLGPVRRGFDAPFGAPAQSPAAGVTADLYARLTDLPDPGPLRLADVREALEIALGVFAAWYRGRGVLVRAGRIEDTATAELARAQLWQWVKVAAALEDGERLTPDRYRQERRAVLGDDEPASRLLDHLVEAQACPAYFPLAAQHLAAQYPVGQRPETPK